MKNRWNWPLWHWHLESSSICKLECPRCPRQEVPETLVQAQLNKDDIAQILIPETKRITFCGDDGDPIYTKNFTSLIHQIKMFRPQISVCVVTNGSSRTSVFWRMLANEMNMFDEIHFSLDGWNQHTNEKYRVGSNWESIITGIETFRTNNHKTRMVWDVIEFEFNEDHILSEIFNTAESYGFNEIQITKSTKFGSKYPHYLNENGVDPLEPKRIAAGHRFERTHIVLEDKYGFAHDEYIAENIDRYNEIKLKYANSAIVPQCMIGNKGMFINSQGYLIPCCWIGNRYKHNDLSELLVPSNNIREVGLEDALNGDHWGDFIAKFDTRPECMSKCNAMAVTREAATRW